MQTCDKQRQRIVRLTPLGDVLSVVDRHVSASAACTCDLAKAHGRIAAEDVHALAALPAGAAAVRDGWAVSSDLVAEAGPYAPVPLAPPPFFVEHGDTLPAGCDAVLPPDGLAATPAGFDAIAPAAPGEGVLPAGFDASAGSLLLRAGARLRGSDLAALSAAGITRIAVRAPRIAVLATRGGLDATVMLVASAVAKGGGMAECAASGGDGFARALATADADAVIAIGGTGQGRSDYTATTLASVGELTIHGMGIRPGESAGFGSCGGRPVLLLPGRLDASLAAWLLIGRRMLSRLAGASDDDLVLPFALTRKITSGIGLADVVLVAPSGNGVAPVASGIFSLHALARASGWVLVPPESEGYPGGATVDVRPLP